MAVGLLKLNTQLVQDCDSHAGCVMASFPQRFSHWSSGVGCIIIMVYCYCYHLKYLGFPWGRMAGSMEAVVSVGRYCTCSSGILPALQPCCHHVLLPPHLTAMRFLPSILQRSGTSESVLSCAQSPNTFCLLWNKWLGVFAEWPWNEHVGFGVWFVWLYALGDGLFWGCTESLSWCQCTWTAMNHIPQSMKWWQRCCWLLCGLLWAACCFKWLKLKKQSEP